MPDLVLYRTVGHLKRVALGDLAKAEFYHASVDDNGVISLYPVNIVDGATRRPDVQPTGAAEYAPNEQAPAQPVDVPFNQG